MSTFTQRTTAPATDNAYYYANNPFYISGYGLPNCTCYAYGRFWELTGGSAPTLSTANAENWYLKNDGYDRGATPKLGAVICWRRGETGNGDDGAGHVAIVEQINADGSIVTSESGWGASSVFWRTTRADDGNWGQSSAYTFQGFIYNPVIFTAGEAGNTQEKYIWDYLLNKIGNKYGVAGLMGNLYAESGLRPNNLQNSYEDSLGYTDASYTAAVDSGAYSKDEFVNDAAGYGLAQWTYWSRKQAMYEKWKSGGYSSIADIDLALDFLWEELNTLFPSVLSTLSNASSVREASDKVLHDFENPADQSTAAEERRESYSLVYYEKFAGYTPTPRPDKTRDGLPLWLLVAATRRH